MNRTIVTQGRTFDKTLLGGKGNNLALLQAAGFNVPDWFAVTPKAFYQSLSDEMHEKFSSANCEVRCAMVADISLSDSIKDELQATIKRMGWEGERLAVRSSSAEEDGHKYSFAGQLESYLDVAAEDVPSFVEKVWRSGFSKTLMVYRELNGMTAPPEPPSVIVQIMVPAAVAGVAFGMDPLSGETDVTTISAVSGTADKLVSGHCDSATYRLRKGLLESMSKEHLGLLDDRLLSNIDHVVSCANAFYGTPQDIEWAADGDGVLYVLQARPITAMGGQKGALAHAPTQNTAAKTAKSTNTQTPNDNRLDIFDNSNIGESYPGITTPLTFSFARKAYQHVYEQFCKLMGVTDEVIEKNSYIFPQMLGLVRGRIYYNLLNWYRLLSLFPGFKTNRRFMEQMMGVKEGLPTEFLKEFDGELPLNEKIADSFALARVFPVLIWKWCRLTIDIVRFNKRVETSLARLPGDVKTLSLSQLAGLYRSLEQDLLLHWDAPIVNDFFAMVAYGVLRGLCAKWLPTHEGIHNQLLCGETGIISTEPVRRLNELAELAAAKPEILNILSQSDFASASKKLIDYPEFYAAYESYLNKFGDRCTGELKLESPTVRDNPRAFMTAIVRLAANRNGSQQTAHNHAQVNRTEAESNVESVLKRDLIKHSLFKLVLWQARTRIRERENLRFLRTRVFGTVRLIFVEIGRQLHERGLLDSPQDIFYLETEEVIRFIEGTSASRNLQVVADARKKEFSEFESMPAPADRLTAYNGINLQTALEIDLQSDLATAVDAAVTSGGSRVGARAVRPSHPALADQSKNLSGLGCCPGIVKGRARVIVDPNVEQLREGELLIAKRTDPGWITVIAQAKGIVVEYGSLLSHTAIVARELGIPTIVSVNSVTTEIKTGDLIEIDGAKGTVCVYAEPPACAPNSTAVNPAPIRLPKDNLSAA